MIITAIVVLGLPILFSDGAKGDNDGTVEMEGNVTTEKPPACLPDHNTDCHEQKLPPCCSGFCLRFKGEETGTCTPSKKPSGEGTNDAPPTTGRQRNNCLPDGNRECHESSTPYCCSGLCHRLPYWKTGVCQSIEQKVNLSCGGAVNGSKTKSDCPGDVFSCSNGQCLAYNKVCDEVCDCPDGSDEGVYCNVPCNDTTPSCVHSCHRTPEGPKCSCPKNFKLDKDGTSCVEIAAESNLKIWLPIAVTLVLLLGIAALGIAYYYRKYQRVQKVLRRLTPEEIAEFLEGKARQLGEVKTDGTEVALSLPFTQTLSADAIKITHSDILGSGHYGIVYKGYYGNEIVAIKTFKRTVEIDEFKAVLSEAKIMAYIGDHPHVVRFIGAEVSEIMDRKLLLVSELSPYGDLLSFIRKSASKFGQTSRYENTRDESLTVATLASWCEQIASAMEYLEAKRVVHGDLAARNVLLFDNFVVKITDFGLSKQLYGNAEYLMKQMRALPWKWASIELLTRHEFSTDSDIWSFGVTAWEIYTLGRPPYEDHQSCQHLMRFLQDGHRMECPAYATPEIHQMLLECWNEFRNLRPRFSKLKDFFEFQARETAGNENRKNVGPVIISPGYVTLLEQEE